MDIGDSVLHIVVYGAISIWCAYGIGRVHQWYRHSMERDRSFREGYNHGYRALFPLAARDGRPTADLAGPTDPEDELAAPLRV
jgi:hypothetical protein